MARLPYLTKDDLPEEHHGLLSRDINLMKLYAHSPVGGKLLSRVGGWIRFDSNLDPRLRELAILQVGYLTRTEYEWSHHVKIGRDFGVSDDDIRAIAVETAGGDSGLEEVAVLTLRAAREMTDDLEISEPTFKALHEHLGNEGILDLTIVISYYNSVVRFLRTLNIDVEEDYLQYLDEFPLPKD